MVVVAARAAAAAAAAAFADVAAKCAAAAAAAAAVGAAAPPGPNAFGLPATWMELCKLQCGATAPKGAMINGARPRATDI